MKDLSTNKQYIDWLVIDIAFKKQILETDAKSVEREVVLWIDISIIIVSKLHKSSLHKYKRRGHTEVVIRWMRCTSIHYADADRQCKHDLLHNNSYKIYSKSNRLHLYIEKMRIWGGVSDGYFFAHIISHSDFEFIDVHHDRYLTGMNTYLVKICESPWLLVRWFDTPHRRPIAQQQSIQNIQNVIGLYLYIETTGDWGEGCQMDKCFAHIISPTTSVIICVHHDRYFTENKYILSVEL